MTDAPTILMAEDDRLIGDLYARRLRRAGYRVDVVVSGTAAEELAKTGRYDLILLDIMLPDKTGVDVIKELRRDGTGLPAARILVITNFDLDELTRTMIEELTDGYFIKADLTPKKLVEIVNNLYGPVA